jgi:hypothetical protein
MEIEHYPIISLIFRDLQRPHRAVDMLAGALNSHLELQLRDPLHLRQKLSHPQPAESQQVRHANTLHTAHDNLLCSPKSLDFISQS